MELVKNIYILTATFPKSEQYGLASQLQRAGVAIPSNIAEGYLRNHRREYIQFTSIALGSAAEIETQLLICRSVGLGNAQILDKCQQLNGEVMKMLTALIRALKKPSSTETSP